MKKTFIAVLVIAALLGCLSSCGSGSAPGVPGGQQAGNSQNAQPEADPEAIYNEAMTLLSSGKDYDCAVKLSTILNYPKAKEQFDKIAEYLPMKTETYSVSDGTETFSSGTTRVLDGKNRLLKVTYTDKNSVSNRTFDYSSLDQGSDPVYQEFYEGSVYLYKDTIMYQIDGERRPVYVLSSTNDKYSDKVIRGYVESYEYDSQGRLTKKVNVDIQSESSSTYTYTYNSSTGKLAVETYTGDYVSSKTYYTYDGEGRLITEKYVSRSANGDSESTTNYTYGENGLLTRESYSSSGGVEYERLYFYNENKDLIRRESRIGDDSGYTYEKMSDYRVVMKPAIGG